MSTEQLQLLEADRLECAYATAGADFVVNVLVAQMCRAAREGALHAVTEGGELMWPNPIEERDA